MPVGAGRPLSRFWRGEVGGEGPQPGDGLQVARSRAASGQRLLDRLVGADFESAATTRVEVAGDPAGGEVIELPVEVGLEQPADLQAAGHVRGAEQAAPPRARTGSHAPPAGCEVGRGEAVADAFAGPVQPAHDGAFGDVEDAGRLGVGEPVDVDEGNDVLEVFGQRRHGGVDDGIKPAADADVLGGVVLSSGVVPGRCSYGCDVPCPLAPFPLLSVRVGAQNYRTRRDPSDGSGRQAVGVRSCRHPSPHGHGWKRRHDFGRLRDARRWARERHERVGGFSADGAGCAAGSPRA